MKGIKSKPNKIDLSGFSNTRTQVRKRPRSGAFIAQSGIEPCQYFENAFTKESDPIQIRIGTAVTFANATDFPSPRKANEGGEKTVAEVERIKRNRIKEKLKKNSRTEEKAPRYYDVLPNQFEDKDGNVPDYANPALDRIRRLNRNLIAQIWTGHRKLPAGILDKEFG